jgi:hypothetical protein
VARRHARELAALSLEVGQIDEAERKARESLALADDMRDYCGRVLRVGVLAAVAADRGAWSVPVGYGARETDDFQPALGLDVSSLSTTPCSLPSPHRLAGWLAPAPRPAS